MTKSFAVLEQVDSSCSMDLYLLPQGLTFKLVFLGLSKSNDFPISFSFLVVSRVYRWQIQVVNNPPRSPDLEPKGLSIDLLSGWF